MGSTIIVLDNISKITRRAGVFPMGRNDSWSGSVLPSPLNVPCLLVKESVDIYSKLEALKKWQNSLGATML